MIEPIRIQRSRQEKQVSPNGLPIVSCSRPGKWANPFMENAGLVFVLNKLEPEKEKWIEVCKGGIVRCLELYKIVVTNKAGKFHIEMNGSVLKHISYWIDHFLKLDINELKGKNLSCWCKLTEKCHTEILLELANGL